MSDAARKAVGDRYVLATGEAAAARLHLLQEVYGPSTERLLSQLGVKDGLRVAEIGCGAGQTACWLANRVAPGGLVDALDVSGDQLDLARANAADAGATNIAFTEASVYDSGLPARTFDLVHCRLLLCHLARPLDALREMVSMLRPGGLLVCEDIDMATLHTDPPSRSYERFVELAVAFGQQRGADYRLGCRLHRLFRDVGIPHPNLEYAQPAYLRGEVKRLWEYTFLEASPAMIDAGLSSKAEVAQLAIELDAIGRDDTTLVAQVRLIAVWGRKP